MRARALACMVIDSHKTFLVLSTVEGPAASFKPWFDGARHGDGAWIDSTKLEGP